VFCWCWPLKAISAAILFSVGAGFAKDKSEHTMIMTSERDESVTKIAPQLPMDILLIEDRDEDISRVEDAVSEVSLTNRVVVARNPAEALMYLRQCVSLGPLDLREDIKEPGLILLDVNMSGRSGLDVLHDLRSDPKLMTIPIVVLTSVLDEDDLACTMAHGVTGYFLKPMDALQLKKVVKDVEEHWSLLTSPPCAN
jgi:CheY-like chemotaxis protein